MKASTALWDVVTNKDCRCCLDYSFLHSWVSTNSATFLLLGPEGRKHLTLFVCASPLPLGVFRASQVQAAQMLPSSPVCGHKSQRQTKGKSGNHPPRSFNQVQLPPPSDGLHDFVKCGLLACCGGRQREGEKTHTPRIIASELSATCLILDCIGYAAHSFTFSCGTSLCS